MKFIEIEELESRKMQHLIDDVSEENNTILDELEEMAIDEVKTYLLGRYDVDWTFSRKGKERNNVIKRIVLDIIICLLWDRTNSNEKPDSLIARCDKNDEFLKNVAKGLIVLDIPTLDSNLVSTNTMKYGSNSKFIQ